MSTDLRPSPPEPERVYRPVAGIIEAGTFNVPFWYAAAAAMAGLVATVFQMAAFPSWLAGVMAAAGAALALMAVLAERRRLKLRRRHLEELLAGTAQPMEWVELDERARLSRRYS